VVNLDAFRQRPAKHHFRYGAVLVSKAGFRLLHAVSLGRPRVRGSSPLKPQPVFVAQAMLASRWIRTSRYFAVSHVSLLVRPYRPIWQAVFNDQVLTHAKV
jgi:hypothetical protein